MRNPDKVADKDQIEGYALYLERMGIDLEPYQMDLVRGAKRWLAERDAEKKNWRQRPEGICKECGAPIVQGKCECDG